MEKFSKNVAILNFFKSQLIRGRRCQYYISRSRAGFDHDSITCKLANFKSEIHEIIVENKIKNKNKMKSPIKMKKVLKKRNVSAWFFVVGSTRHVEQEQQRTQKKTGKGLRRRRK
jgi:hypothetical protein